MSEDRYYEFFAVDRPLDEREVAELRRISTRADITPTHFSNEYTFGDLKADPADLLERYFDVHVYLANWGTHRLAMRLPRDVVTTDELGLYLVSEGASACHAGEHVIIDFWSECEEPEDRVDERVWMASLAGVRRALAPGGPRLWCPTRISLQDRKAA